jgi:retron-type reverse transcriptase
LKRWEEACRLRPVLNQIREEDFQDFSYGFRPGSHRHKALDALYAGITSRKVNFVLDLDIRSFFDKVGHDHLKGSYGIGLEMNGSSV